MTRPHPVSSKLRHAHHHVQLAGVVNIIIRSALVMDAAVPKPSKVLALLSSLGIAQLAYSCMPLLFGTLYLIIVQSFSTSSPKFF